MLLPHATQGALKRYSLGFLNGEDQDLIEEHLLICEDCRRALSLVDYGISQMRQTLSEAEFQEQANAIRTDRFLMFKPASSAN